MKLIRPEGCFGVDKFSKQFKPVGRPCLPLTRGEVGRKGRPVSVLELVRYRKKGGHDDASVLFGDQGDESKRAEKLCFVVDDIESISRDLALPVSLARGVDLAEDSRRSLRRQVLERC